MKNTQVGIPSPNPSYPSPVNVVKGDNEVVVSNKNLYKYSDVIGTVSTGTPTHIFENETAEILGTATWSNFALIFNNTKKSQDYCLSAEFVSSLARTTGFTAYGTDVFNYTANDLTTLKTSSSAITSNVSQKISCNYNSGNYKYIVIRIWTNFSATALSSSVSLFLNNIQLEQNTQATSYVPHAEQVYPISLGSIELAKIGNYQDKLFKAISGDVVYDSLTNTQKEGLTSGKWYKYGAIGKVVLNGSETWTATQTTNVFWCTNNDYLPISNTIICISNRYQPFKNITAAGDLLNSYEVSFNVNKTSYPRLYVKNKDCVTTTALESELSTRNALVYYVLATPTFTEITDTTLITQLENWRNSKSYQGQTNISQTNEDKAFVISYTTLKDVYSELDSRLKALEG